MGKNKPRPMTGPKPDPKPLTPEQRAAQGKGKPVGPQLHTDLRRAREEVARIKREGGTIMSIDIEVRLVCASDTCEPVLWAPNRYVRRR